MVLPDGPERICAQLNRLFNRMLNILLNIGQIAVRLYESAETPESQISWLRFSFRVGFPVFVFSGYGLPAASNRLRR